MLVRSSPVRRSPPARSLIFASAAAGGVCVVVVLLMLTGGPPPEQAAAERFVTAWEKQDFSALRAGEVGDPDDGVVIVPMTVSTRVFGTLRAPLRLRFSGEDDDKRVAWSPSLVFPGLAAGERLERSTQMPRRADILARDGTPLAQGEDRSSPIADVAASILGELGPAPKERVARLRELGYPAGARVGTSGLERVFEERVAGIPGGELRA